jgi:hypothetical protein
VAGFCEQDNEPLGSIKKGGYSFKTLVMAFQIMSCTMELVS